MKISRKETFKTWLKYKHQERFKRNVKFAANFESLPWEVRNKLIKLICRTQTTRKIVNST